MEGYIAMPPAQAEDGLRVDVGPRPEIGSCIENSGGSSECGARDTSLGVFKFPKSSRKKAYSQKANHPKSNPVLGSAHISTFLHPLRPTAIRPPNAACFDNPTKKLRIDWLPIPRAPKQDLRTLTAREEVTLQLAG